MYSNNEQDRKSMKNCLNVFQTLHHQLILDVVLHFSSTAKLVSTEPTTQKIETRPKYFIFTQLYWIDLLQTHTAILD